MLSSDHDWSIMSAEANLAGMFPPTEEESWMKGLNWQPLPVHSIPTQYDNVSHSPHFEFPYFPDKTLVFHYNLILELWCPN